MIMGKNQDYQISEKENTSVEYQDVFDNLNVQNWFKTLAIAEPLAFSTLVGDNRQNFKKIFGQPSGEQNGSLFWQIADQGLMFVITTNDSESTYMVKYLGNNDNFQFNMKVGVYLVIFMQGILEKLSR